MIASQLFLLLFLLVVCLQDVFGDSMTLRWKGSGKRNRVDSSKSRSAASIQRRHLDPSFDEETPCSSSGKGGKGKGGKDGGGKGYGKGGEGQVGTRRGLHSMTRPSEVLNRRDLETEGCDEPEAPAPVPAPAPADLQEEIKIEIVVEELQVTEATEPTDDTDDTPSNDEGPYVFEISNEDDTGN